MQRPDGFEGKADAQRENKTRQVCPMIKKHCRVIGVKAQRRVTNRATQASVIALKKPRRIDAET